MQGRKEEHWEYTCQARKEVIKDRQELLAGRMDNWLSITNHIRKQMKCDDFGSFYDCSVTIEQNIAEFKDYGVRTTPKTLKKWLDENGIPYKTDKGIRDEHVIQFYEQNSTRSSREIERLCNQIGIEVNYRTIQRILSRHNSKTTQRRLNVCRRLRKFS